MEPGIVTRDTPPLYLRGMVRPKSVDKTKRTADVVWSTGQRVLRGVFEKIYEELSLDPAHVRMGRLKSGAAPLLNAHQDGDAATVIGVVENAVIDGGEGIATVRFAKAEDDAEADKIFRKVDDGIVKNVSVGYRIYRAVKVEDSADKIPVYRVVDWEPYEISVTPMGQDAGAGFRSETHESTNPCVFDARQEQHMADEIKTTPTPVTGSPIELATRAAAAARLKETQDRAASEAKAREEAAQAERTRMVEIRRIVRGAKLGDDLADKLIADGASADAVRAAVLDHLADAGNGVRTEQHVRFGPGDDARDKFVRGASAALFEQAGVGDLIERAAKVDPRRFRDVALDPGEFRGFKPSELARLSLERRGVKTGGMSRMEMVGLALTYRAGYQTTSDFAVLFENVLYKSLLAAYATVEDTWSKFCRTDVVADFRPSNRFRTGSLTVLDAVDEHGEFKNKAMPDGQKTPISVATKGNILALSRQTIVNDDMGALADMSTKLGRAARLSIEVDVYALLAANGGLGPTQSDAQPFFHANRSNVNGTASLLNAAGIDADRVVMGAQKDISSNDFLDLRPAILLVAAGQGATARVLNGAPYNPIDNRFEQPNPVRGLFRDIIDTPRFTGTRRYILADPAIAPIIVVAFLEGQGQAPVLESERGWRVDGVEWKVRLDYKAQMFDPKGGVTNAGL